MSKKPIILGIESSCDETAASIVTENEQGIPVVLSNIVSSQVEIRLIGLFKKQLMIAV